MPAVTFRAAGTSPGANGESCVITKPAGLAVGDLMIAQVVGYNAAGSAGYTAPANWASIREDNRTGTLVSALFWKIADAADVAAANFTFTATGAATNRGAISAWYNHKPSSPIGANNGQGNASSTTITTPAITPAAANSVILMFGAVAWNTSVSGYAVAVSNPASWTERYDINISLAVRVCLALGSGTRPETTATGNGTATSGIAQINVGQLVSISPPGGRGWYK